MDGETRYGGERWDVREEESLSLSLDINRIFTASRHPDVIYFDSNKTCNIAHL